MADKKDEVTRIYFSLNFKKHLPADSPVNAFYINISLI